MRASGLGLIVVKSDGFSFSFIRGRRGAALAIHSRIFFYKKSA
jgi:hypothetical protein